MDKPMIHSGIATRSTLIQDPSKRCFDDPRGSNFFAEAGPLGLVPGNNGVDSVDGIMARGVVDVRCEMRW
jgi:hypothetical protein